jgi:hypothetical protein
VWGLRYRVPLQGMQLGELGFVPRSIAAGLEAIRQTKSLVKINDLPIEQFWRKSDAGEFNR